MKPWIKVVMGLLVMFSVIGFIVAWDLFFKERIDAVEVVVAAKDIGKKEEITKSMLTIENRRKSTIVEGVVLASEIDKLIGTTPSGDILKNSIISTKLIDFDNMVPNPKKGEAIRPIPQEWIFAKPGSLRRKDLVDIYLWKPIEEKTQESKTPEVVMPSDDLDLEITKGQKPLLKNVPVLYVKDSSNKEVVNAGEEERLNASAIISDLELNIKQEDFDQLMNATKAGYKLYITYN